MKSKHTMKKLLLILSIFVVSLSAIAADLNPFAYGLKSEYNDKTQTLTINFTLNAPASYVKLVVLDGTTEVWTKEYLAGGEAAFEPKARPGNKFAALHRSKNLSELERLRLLVAKPEIEIARLKKGYWVEGVGANRAYVTGQDVNTKSSKK